MFSDALGWFHFWGWQSIIVAAAVTLPLGLTSSKEYAELEWPIDIAIAVVWVAFTVNLIGTIVKRPAASRATRSTPASRMPWCSGGTDTTPSPSS